MDPGRASLTAMGTALMRADHARSARQPLIDDAWGDRLVSDADRETLRAGMDSFALRRPAFAEEVQVFEVDHPDTQRFKLGRLAECDFVTPPGAHYIGADLAAEGVDEALARAPFDAREPSFFSWLGVTAYLTKEANLETLRSIARCGAPSSELVFDYGDQQAYDNPPDSGALIRIRARLARIGEPWISGFHPAELGDELRAVGLELVENLSPEELHRRYCAGSPDELTPSPSHYLARACVSA